MYQNNSFRVGPGKIDLSARKGGVPKDHLASPPREDRWRANNHASQHYHWIQNAEKE
jgi:hypothetical protein